MEFTTMGSSCCGGHGHGKGEHAAEAGHTHGPGHSCCGHSHAKKSSTATWVIAAVVLAMMLFVAVSAIAFGQPATAPAPTVAPTQPKAPTSAADPTKPAPAVKKGYDPATDGVVRHGRPEPIAKPEGAIRVVTYNIENLFDTASTSDEGGSSTPAKPAAHRKAVADAIRRINPDVLAVEEIESKEVLTKFRDEYLKDMGFAYVASIDAGDGRGIEQSILSKYPIKDEINWPGTPLVGVHPEKLGKKANPDAGKPLILKRSPMRATVVVPAPESEKDAKPTELTFFVVHHKSGPYFGYMREAEGAKVLELVHAYEKEHAGAPVIVLGDFNARTTEKSVQVYTSGGLVDAMTGVPGGVESTGFLSHSSGRTIDHILLNAPAAAMVSLDTRFVLGMPQRPDGVDWRKTEPPAGYGSDHYPVVVDLLPREIPGAKVRRGVSKADEKPQSEIQSSTPASDSK